MSQAGPTTLFNVISGLRHFGVGTKVTRSIFKFPETYWIVTKVKMSPDQAHGKVYGRLVWRGLPKGKDEKIHSSLKREWKLVDFPDYRTFNNKAKDIETLIPKNTTRTC